MKFIYKWLKIFLKNSEAIIQDARVQEYTSYKNPIG